MQTGYKAATVRTGSLMLDPKNARLPTERRSDNQRALLQALLETEDIRDLAKSIAKLGIFPNERLVVMRDGPKYCVLEGNRRLAAVKLLLNPELAPTEAEVRAFRRLSGQADLQALSSLDVAIVQDRVAAAPIIAALHVGQPKKSWSNLQQARFYRELVDQGQSVQDVAAELGITTGELQSRLRAELLHRMALTLDYTPDVRKKIEHPRFPLSTLERFIESKQGRKAIGLDIGPDGQFRGTVHIDRFKAVLAKVASDVAQIEGLTRKVNDDAGMRTYFEGIEPHLPETSKRGSFSVQDIIEPGPSNAPNAQLAETTPTEKRTPRISSSVIPTGFTCSSKHERVRALFGELKGIKITPQFNTTGIIFRVLIDISLWLYINDRGLADAVRNHYDPNRKKRNYDHSWTPPLRDLISYMVDKQQFEGMDAAGYKAIRLLAAQNGDIISIDGFNAYTHNPYVTPTESELRALWQRASPMLEIILNN